MKVFLIWIGLICCSVANGIFFNLHKEISGMPIAIGISCVVAIYLLYLHRKITKDWKRQPDPWSGYRFPIFSITLFFSVFALIMVWLISKIDLPVMTGLITIAVASAIAFWREKDYTEEI